MDRKKYTFELKQNVRRYRDFHKLSYEDASFLLIEKAHELKLSNIKGIKEIIRKTWNERERRNIFLTPIGNGERLISEHGDRIKFCNQRGIWYLWDDQRWAEDIDQGILRLALETVRRIKDESDNEIDKKKRARLLKHWLRSEKISQLREMAKTASIHKDIGVQPEDLDTNKWLLNCLNGTLNLKSGTIQDHNKQDLITKIAPVNIELDSKSAIWEKFVFKAVGEDVELYEFLRRAVGYSLTGEIGEKCLFFIIGETDTGKTTFIETIKKILGDYAKSTEFHTFLYKKYSSAIRNDIARLEGARFVSASEVARHEKLDVPTLKQITGRDKVMARFLYKEFTEFTPEFKIFLAANDMPKIAGLDQAIKNRIHIIRFVKRIPKNLQDQKFLERLISDSSGILSWALKGCLDWQEKGLNPPNSSTITTKDLIDENDIIVHFLNTCCFRPFSNSIFVKQMKTPFGELFEAWKLWCNQNKTDPGSQIAFSKNLTDLGFEKDRTQDFRYFRGIYLKEKLRKALAASINHSADMTDEFDDLEEYLASFEKE